MLYFTWDPSKADKNLAKHGVEFVDAESVFDDPNGVLISDNDGSHEEDRFVLLGFSAQARLLVVVHCYRDEDRQIRIISARKANKRESKFYIGSAYER